MTENLKFIKKSKRTLFDTQNGIITREFPTLLVKCVNFTCCLSNYDGYENKLKLAQIVSNNQFLSDFKIYWVWEIIVGWSGTYDYH